MVVHEPMKGKIPAGSLTSFDRRYLPPITGYADSSQVGWTLDPCIRLVLAPFNMFIMVDMYTIQSIICEEVMVSNL